MISDSFMKTGKPSPAASGRRKSRRPADGARKTASTIKIGSITPVAPSSSSEACGHSAVLTGGIPTMVQHRATETGPFRQCRRSLKLEANAYRSRKRSSGTKSGLRNGGYYGPLGPQMGLQPSHPRPQRRHDSRRLDASVGRRRCYTSGRLGARRSTTTSSAARATGQHGLPARSQSAGRLESPRSSSHHRSNPQATTRHRDSSFSLFSPIC